MSERDPEYEYYLEHYKNRDDLTLEDFYQFVKLQFMNGCTFLSDEDAEKFLRQPEYFEEIKDGWDDAQEESPKHSPVPFFSVSSAVASNLILEW